MPTRSSCTISTSARPRSSRVSISCWSAGGIDCEDAAPLRERLQRFQARALSLWFAALCRQPVISRSSFVELVPEADGDSRIRSRTTLSSRTPTVFEAVRRAYLDDLVYKEGVSELGRDLSTRNTADARDREPRFPARVLHALDDQRSSVPASCLDIGGATTDLHYTVEIIRDESDDRPSTGLSVARYVFTDLGIVASRDSLLLQLRTHPRLYEFLERRARARTSRDLSAAARGRLRRPAARCFPTAASSSRSTASPTGEGPGLPTADLSKVAQIMLTGGAAQALATKARAARVFELLAAEGGAARDLIDRALPALGRRHHLVRPMPSRRLRSVTWTGPIDRTSQLGDSTRSARASRARARHTFYLYDADVVNERIRRVRDAFAGHVPRSTTRSRPIRISNCCAPCAAAADGLDISSGGELEQALLAGFDAATA